MTKKKMASIMFDILHGNKPLPTDGAKAVKEGFIEELVKKHNKDDLQAILYNSLSTITHNKYALRHWINNGKIPLMWTEDKWISNCKRKDIILMDYIEAWEVRDNMSSKYPDEIEVEIILMEGCMDLGEAVK